jgi:hypothetical protein
MSHAPTPYAPSLLGHAPSKRFKTQHQYSQTRLPLCSPSFSLLQQGQSLSRKQAVRKVSRWLQREHLPVQTERKLMQVLSVFRLEGEELLEAGVSYEQLKALQQRHWLI